MSETVVLFVGDLEKMFHGYARRIAAQKHEAGAKVTSACLSDLVMELQRAGDNIERSRTLAPVSDASLHLHHQTLGIVQEAEAQYNTVQDDEDLLIKARHFACLTDRFLNLLS